MLRHALQKDSCQFPFNYEYKVSENFDKNCKKNSIKNSR